MPRYALINPSNAIDHFAENVDPNVQTKSGWKWLPADPVSKPAFDAKTQVREGPNYTVEATSVTESYAVRSKTSQEIDADKDAAVNGATNGNLYQALGKIILHLENDNRLIKAKINEIAPGSFTTGQASQVTMAQLKTALKGLLS